MIATARQAFAKSWRYISNHVGVRPRVDPGRVGITFVDVLFALVVGLALAPLGNWWKISPAGWSHLAVAITLTLLSWIGYHNSANRPQWVIGFINLPFFLFALDITMVITYAFAVFTAETVTKGASTLPSILPEAWAVAVSFVLYALWDFANLRLKRHPPYAAAWQRAQDDGLLQSHERLPTDRPYRRYVTLYFLAISVESIVIAYRAEAEYRHLPVQWAVGFDVWLVVLLFAYRIAKDWQFRLVDM